ncbi:IS200/IS605 family transposase [Taurinivorans muris]|uniref:IS200/IS605 family transposase n=1 Tax=Taurinivorans muris TaxID=2787751 RepID=A0ABY5Y3U1_9BACT|nr:IS200/IS605 family transposase [Desulfovibrionaceae bacterium LT0009]
MTGNQSLSHTKWNCKYHIVFAPKYRRQIIYNKLKEDIGKILRQLCEQKKVEIHEANACKDHIHMLVSIPPNLSVSSFMGYLKGKNSLMIFDRHANLKYKYGNRHFWCRGYYLDTVGKNTEKIKAYIQNQLNEDIMTDQYSLKEYYDPFTGSKNK